MAAKPGLGKQTWCVPQRSDGMSKRRLNLMRRFEVTAALLLLCFLLPTALEARGAKRYLKKESTVDMKSMNHIFLGWVDLNPDSWVLYQHEGTLWNRGVPFSKISGPMR